MPASPPHHVSSLDSGFAPTPEQVRAFRENGYVKLPGFFNLEAVELLRERVETELGSAANAFRDAFTRLKYDFESDKDALYGLMATPAFQRAIAEIVGRRLFMTFELCFELGRNESKGFPWHVGVQSFGYQHADDFGCTIWAPLDPIDTKTQGGGMRYVPRNVVTGRFVYDDIETAIVSTLEREKARGVETKLEDFFFLRTGVLNGPAFSRILEAHAEEDDFAPGDVFLFDKYVVHRSVMLGEGPLARRRAFVMRFVEVGSRYDRQRALNLEYPVETWGYRAFTQSHLHVGSRDGEIISDSPFFDRHADRIVGRAA